MKRVVIALLAGCCCAAASTAHAQYYDYYEQRPKVRLSGLAVQLGAVDPNKASTGFGYGVVVGLGTVLHPRLDFAAEANRWTASEVRDKSDRKLNGDLSDWSLAANLRWNLFEYRRIGPYVMSGISAHLAGADIPNDPTLEDALDGFQAGFDLGTGLAFHAENGWRIGAESRWVLANNIGNWSVLARVGWWPRSRQGGQLQTVAVPAVQVQPAATSKSPADANSASTAPAPGEVVILQDLVRDLLAENRHLQSEVDRLRSNVETRDNAEVARARSSAAELEAQRAALKRALEEVQGLTGQVESLRETQDGFLLSIKSSLLFASGKSEMQVGALEEMRRIAAVLMRYPDLNIVVEGHTDAYGDARFNQQLSEQRAAAVQRELVRLGVDPAKIRALGFGSERPIADNRSAESRARNRRVEIRLLQPGAVSP